MEICENSGLLMRMVPRLHQSNGYIKRKLRLCRVQKCIALFGAKAVLRRARPQTTPLHWGQYRAENGNIRNFGPTNPHGTAFVPKQWLYQKEDTGMESSKMYCLVGAETVLTSAGPQITPFHWGQYRAGNGNMQNFGPTNPHGTTFALKQWLY